MWHLARSYVWGPVVGSPTSFLSQRSERSGVKTSDHVLGYGDIRKSPKTQVVLSHQASLQGAQPFWYQSQCLEAVDQHCSHHQVLDGGGWWCGRTQTFTPRISPFTLGFSLLSSETYKGGNGKVEKDNDWSCFIWSGKLIQHLPLCWSQSKPWTDSHWLCPTQSHGPVGETDKRNQEYKELHNSNHWDKITEGRVLRAY